MNGTIKTKLELLQTLILDRMPYKMLRALQSLADDYIDREEKRHKACLEYLSTTTLEQEMADLRKRYPDMTDEELMRVEKIF